MRYKWFIASVKSNIIAYQTSNHLPNTEKKAKNITLLLAPDFFQVLISSHDESNLQEDIRSNLNPMILWLAGAGLTRIDPPTQTSADLT
jgi:hypothetical protein